MGHLYPFWEKKIEAPFFGSFKRGKPTKSCLATLKALKERPLLAKEVSEITGQPLFKVRSGLRELADAKFVKQIDDKFDLTPTGKKLIH